MVRRAPRILILGAGVIGLTTAHELQRRGHAVSIWAKDLPPGTTSDAAGAIWFPYLCGPADKVPGWSATGLAVFRDLAREHPTAGCDLMPVRMFFDAEPAIPDWHDLLPDLTTEPAPAGTGYPWTQTFTSVLIDVSVYMPHLLAAVVKGGAAIERRELHDLNETIAFADIVINCTGLGSLDLVADDDLHAVRGQTVRVSGPAPAQALIDDDAHNALAYVFPRRNDILVGGTSQHGDVRLEPDPDETAAILQRAAELYPAVASATVLGASVGLRPGRSSVRLLAGETAGTWLIHNYGHGGAGFTLSWGCAAEVGEIVDSIAG